MFSKPITETSDDIWAVEINGKRGYAPKKFIQEDRIIVPKAELITVTDLANNVPAKEVPETVKPSADIQNKSAEKNSSESAPPIVNAVYTNDSSERPKRSIEHPTVGDDSKKIEEVQKGIDVSKPEEVKVEDLNMYDSKNFDGNTEEEDYSEGETDEEEEGEDENDLDSPEEVDNSKEPVKEEPFVKKTAYVTTDTKAETPSSSGNENVQPTLEIMAPTQSEIEQLKRQKELEETEKANQTLSKETTKSPVTVEIKVPLSTTVGNTNPALTENERTTTNVPINIPQNPLEIPIETTTPLPSSVKDTDDTTPPQSSTKDTDEITTPPSSTKDTSETTTPLPSLTKDADNAPEVNNVESSFLKDDLIAKNDSVPKDDTITNGNAIQKEPPETKAAVLDEIPPFKPLPSLSYNLATDTSPPAIDSSDSATIKPVIDRPNDANTQGENSGLSNDQVPKTPTIANDMPSTSTASSNEFVNTAIPNEVPSTSLNEDSADIAKESETVNEKLPSEVVKEVVNQVEVTKDTLPLEVVEEVSENSIELNTEETPKVVDETPDAITAETVSTVPDVVSLEELNDTYSASEQPNSFIDNISAKDAPNTESVDQGFAGTVEPISQLPSVSQEIPVDNVDNLNKERDGGEGGIFGSFFNSIKNLFGGSSTIESLIEDDTFADHFDKTLNDILFSPSAATPKESAKEGKSFHDIELEY